LNFLTDPIWLTSGTPFQYLDKMTNKIKLKDTNWVMKVGVIGGWMIAVSYVFYFLVALAMEFAGIY